MIKNLFLINKLIKAYKVDIIVISFSLLFNFSILKFFKIFFNKYPAFSCKFNFEQLINIFAII